MTTLLNKTCEACNLVTEKASEILVSAWLQEITDWQLISVAKVKQLERIFIFKDFQQALIFTNKIGMLAEQENHHPMLITEWGQVTVRWWTHSIQGLHQNDFICAAKTDALYSSR